MVREKFLLLMIESRCSIVLTKYEVRARPYNCIIPTVTLWFYSCLTGADVRVVDMKRLLGSGILHTKFIIADNRSFYLGSANMDWRSLTQVCMSTVNRGSVRYCRHGWYTVL